MLLTTSTKYLRFKRDNGSCIVDGVEYEHCFQLDTLDIPPVVTITSDADSCNIIIKRKWTATDLCNNETVDSQLITIIDEVFPTLNGIPADITISSCESIPAVPTVTGQDCRVVPDCDAEHADSYTDIGVGNPQRALGPPDGSFAVLGLGDEIILDLTETVPADQYIRINLARANASGSVTIYSSIDGTNFNNVIQHGFNVTPEPAIGVFMDVMYHTKYPVRFIKVVRNEGSCYLDAITYDICNLKTKTSTEDLPVVFEEISEIECDGAIKRSWTVTCLLYTSDAADE